MTYKLDISRENHYPSRVSNATRIRKLRRTHAATGAPWLLAGWVSALLVGTRVLGGVAARHDWLPSATTLTVWWWLMVLGVAGHLGARLGLRGALDEGASDADRAGGPLRTGAAALALGASVTLLFLVAGVLFQGRTAPEIYALLDRALSGFAGVGVACAVGAGSGLYLAEELPRAAHALGLVRPGSGQRAMQVIALVIGCILFAASMNLVSHFSVGQALLGGAPGGTP